MPPLYWNCDLSASEARGAFYSPHAVLLKTNKQTKNSIILALATSFFFLKQEVIALHFGNTVFSNPPFLKGVCPLMCYFADSSCGYIRPREGSPGFPWLLIVFQSRKPSQFPRPIPHRKERLGCFKVLNLLFGLRYHLYQKDDSLSKTENSVFQFLGKLLTFFPPQFCFHV